jgi:hypothetical protein
MGEDGKMEESPIAAAARRRRVEAERARIVRAERKARVEVDAAIVDGIAKAFAWGSSSRTPDAYLHDAIVAASHILAGKGLDRIEALKLIRSRMLGQAGPK